MEPVISINVSALFWAWSPATITFLRRSFDSGETLSRLFQNKALLLNDVARAEEPRNTVLSDEPAQIR
jgi:hypothetical protein